MTCGDGGADRFTTMISKSPAFKDLTVDGHRKKGTSNCTTYSHVTLVILILSSSDLTPESQKSQQEKN